jgi:hypothetical protein
MANGLAQAAGTNILNALGNATAYSVAQLYVQLHIGAPGGAGTANQATETSRKAVSFGVATGATMVNDAAFTWTNIAGSQTPTAFTAWDAATAGNFIFSGAVTSAAYSAGNTLNFAAGSLTVTFTIAS